MRSSFHFMALGAYKYCALLCTGSDRGAYPDKNSPFEGLQHTSLEATRNNPYKNYVEEISEGRTFNCPKIRPRKKYKFSL
jgi:hypothetical protein